MGEVAPPRRAGLVGSVGLEPDVGALGFLLRRRDHLPVSRRDPQPPGPSRRPTGQCRRAAQPDPWCLSACDRLAARSIGVSRGTGKVSCWSVGTGAATWSLRRTALPLPDGPAIKDASSRSVVTALCPGVPDAADHDGQDLGPRTGDRPAPRVQQAYQDPRVLLRRLQPKGTRRVGDRWRGTRQASSITTSGRLDGAPRRRGVQRAVTCRSSDYQVRTRERRARLPIPPRHGGAGQQQDPNDDAHQAEADPRPLRRLG